MIGTGGFRVDCLFRPNLEKASEAAPRKLPRGFLKADEDPSAVDGRELPYEMNEEVAYRDGERESRPTEKLLAFVKKNGVTRKPDDVKVGLVLPTEPLLLEGPFPLSVNLSRVEALGILSLEMGSGLLVSPRPGCDCGLPERAPNRKGISEVGEVALEAISVGETDGYCIRARLSCGM